MTRSTTDGAPAPPGYRLRPARDQDPARLAPHLRAADRAELRAASGLAPLEALERSVRGSERAFTVETADGAIAAIFGVGRHPRAPDIGAPWLLGSERLLELKTPFLRRSRAWVADLGRGFDLLVNIVDARNRVHIRWLGWAGFTFLRRLPDFGPERRPFYEFVHLTKGGDHV